MKDSRGLYSISLVLNGTFSQKILWRHQLINSICIIGIGEALIYMRLLTITCLHNKAAVVTKNAC